MKIDRRGGLFIVSAPSGTGKSTVIHGVMKSVTDLSFSISYTTREARAGEKDGREYFFVSDTRFQQMVDEGEFLEHARVFGKYWYGTSKSQVEALLEAGNDVIMDIDVQGALQLMVRKDIPHTSVFLIPPDLAQLRQRLMNRKREGSDEIGRRLVTAREELKALPDFDYVVVNDHLETAVDEVRHIVLAQRLQTGRIKDTGRIEKAFQLEEENDG